MILKNCPSSTLIFSLPAASNMCNGLISKQHMFHKIGNVSAVQYVQLSWLSYNLYRDKSDKSSLPAEFTSCY